MALDISSGGTLKVGDTLVDGTVTAGVGTLQTKDLTLELNGLQDSTLVFDLNGGSTAGTNYDQISVTGAVTAGGELTINLGNSFTAAVGDDFFGISGFVDRRLRCAMSDLFFRIHHLTPLHVRIIRPFLSQKESP